MLRTLLLSLYTALLLALAACGTAARPGTGAAVQLTPNPLGAPALPASLPQLPADEQLNPLRMTAALAAGQLGSDFSQRSGNSVLNGSELQLPSAANTVAWGLYLYGGAPGEEISSLDLQFGGYDSGEQIFVALGDYSTGRWSYLPPLSASTANFDLPGSGGASPLQSPLGNTWILIATFGGDDVSVQSLTLNYPNRHNASGQVLNAVGAGIPDVLVTSVFAGTSAVTAADGSYSLPGLPDGDWPIICTKDGWAFYSQPTFVTMAGADALIPDIIGDMHGSRFAASDLVPNDNPTSAPPLNLEAAALDESLSADDDPTDCFRFSVTADGNYLLKFSNPALDILSPYMSLMDSSFNALSSSASVLRGEMAMALTVNDAPREYVCRIQAFGGGGRYQLSLVPGERGRIGFTMATGMVLSGGGHLDVENVSSGITTTYLYNAYVPSNLGYAVYDPCYPLGSINVTPAMNGYTFTPANASLTVMPGSVASQNFVPTPPAMADSFEPNNTTGSAHPLTVPYDSTTNPDPLQLTANTDGTDVYSCTPAAGTALAVAVMDTQILPTAPRYNVAVLDSSFSSIATVTVVPGMVLCLPSALCDGSVVYIIVNLDESKNQRQPYSLNLIPVPSPVKFQSAARLNGSALLPNARFVYYDNSFNRFYPMYAVVDGLTPPVYLTQGTELRIDCYRYGTGHNLQTRLYTLPATDSVLYFESDTQSPDALEPNDDSSLPLPLQNLPFSVDASLDNQSDGADNYLLDAGDGQPFRLTLSNADDGRFLYNAYDSVGNYVGGGPLVEGQPVYFPNDGNPGQRLEIYLHGTSNTQAYTLLAETGPAYSITGVVQDTAFNGLDAQVMVLGTDDMVYSSSGAGGAYDFYKLFAPGTYSVAAVMPNYDPGDNVQQVTISNADVTVDFTNFTAMNHDFNEPNDDTTMATPIMLMTDYPGAIGGGADYGDYYAITLTTGDRIRVTLTPDYAWHPLTMGLLDQFTAYAVHGLRQPDGRVFLDYSVPQTAVYNFYVNGFAHYSLRIDKLN